MILGKMVLVRHGQSQWNLENKFTGWVDVPLSTKGREEAISAGKKLKDTRFDTIYVSHLIRAIQTLHYILLELSDTRIPIVYHEEKHIHDWEHYSGDRNKEIPVYSLSIILEAEAAAAFDELTRSNRDTLLARQHRYAWPNIFRTARYITAVEYIQANRIRYDLVQDMHDRLNDFDVVVTPTFRGGDQLLATNLTGHPVVVVPNGFKETGSPTSISFLGNMFDEGTILAVAAAYQGATGFHEKRPRLFSDLE